MTLTNTEIKKLKPNGKEYQKADSRGLALIIRAKGSKFWRGELRLENKKFRYGYGNYPEISLVNARKIHAVARELVAFGKHPRLLLDTPGVIQLIIDDFSIKEIEAKAVAVKEEEQIQALITFGNAANKYKTEVAPKIRTVR